MKREEQIRQASIEYTYKNRPMCICGGAFSEIEDEMNRNYAFEEGAKWADENPNKKLVYTKKELLDMGFGFDLNGNISTPQEIEENTKKYINYQKDKWIKTACEWLKENIDLYSYNAFNTKSGYTEITLTDVFETAFRQAMEE